MSDRDANGRFVKGNNANPNGRPPKEREERYRSILLTTITYDRFQRIVDKLAKKAEGGDTQAAKLLLEYLVGTPDQNMNFKGSGVFTLRVVRDMESGSRIPDPSTNAARQTSGDKGQ